jgi:hypothetical protein
MVCGMRADDGAYRAEVAKLKPLAGPFHYNVNNAATSLELRTAAL